MVQPQLGVTFMCSTDLPPFFTTKSWETGSVSITSPKLKLVSGTEMEGTCKFEGEELSIAKTDPVPKHQMRAHKTHHFAN
jgi:hypothetical protein